MKTKTKTQDSAKSRAMKLRWRNPAFRTAMSELSKRSWGDPASRRRRIRRMRGPKSVAHRRRIGAAMKRAWQRPAFRQQMVAMMARRSRSPLSRRRRSQAAIRQWANPMIRQRLLDGIRRRWSDPAYRRRMARMLKRRWRDEAFRCRMLPAIRRNLGPSRGAQALHAWLGDGWALEWWTPHGPIDVALPQLKLAIEVDGCDHQKPKQQHRDRQKERGLRRLGWTVFRVSEDGCRELGKAVR